MDGSEACSSWEEVGLGTETLLTSEINQMRSQKTFNKTPEAKLHFLLSRHIYILHSLCQLIRDNRPTLTQVITKSAEEQRAFKDLGHQPRTKFSSLVGWQVDISTARGGRRHLWPLGAPRHWVLSIWRLRRTWLITRYRASRGCWEGAEDSLFK